jgi:uncharacterized membrane protein
MTFRKPFSRIIHLSFEVGILLKGVDGVLEVLGGFLLSVLSPHQISRATALLTQHELSRDPNDFIANHLLSAAQGFSGEARTFAVLYLLSHGVLKVSLVWALWRSQFWAYPTAMAVFTAFGAYQIYRYLLSPSLAMVMLTVLDALVIWLTWTEYRRLKGERTRFPWLKRS